MANDSLVGIGRNNSKGIGMTYTVEDARAYVAANHAGMIQGLMKCTEVPGFMKQTGGFLEDVWCSGCWLATHLLHHGATEQQKRDIGFAHGQRCFGSDPYAVAVAYVNEFVAAGEVSEKPGLVLAEKICIEVFGE